MKVVTFGCSLTRYNWPTWASILLTQAELHGYKTDNWGCPGTGNFYIAIHIQEAIARKLIQPGDHVIICWASFLREDRFVLGNNPRWLAAGNIFGDHSLKHAHDQNWVDRFANVNFSLYRDLTLIQSTQQSLDQIGVVHSHFKAYDYIEVRDGSNDKLIAELDSTFNLKFDYSDLMPFLIRQEKIKITPVETQFNVSNESVADVHPQPKHHLTFVKKCMLSNNKHAWLNQLDPTIGAWVESEQLRIHNLPKPLNANTHPLPAFKTEPWQLTAESFR